MSRQVSRRTCLAVPGSNPRMMDKARGLPADQFFLDLEDAVAPAAKAEARHQVAEAIQGDWGGKVRSVRVNDLSTEWTYRDVVSVVEAAGSSVDTIILPKVRSADEVRWLDLTLSQIERATGLVEGAIGIEAQIEDASGVVHTDAIAAASERLQTLIFGPADFMASVNMRSLTVGQQPPGYETGDAYHYVLMRLLIAARARNLQVIDGPYLRIQDLDGLEQVSRRSAALGYDGKWVLHPSQIELVNEIFNPSQADYDHAENILDAYAWHTSQVGGHRGAVMLGDEMIDEASRKMAEVIAAKGRAAGMQRSTSWTPPDV